MEVKSLCISTSNADAYFPEAPQSMLSNSCNFAYLIGKKKYLSAVFIALLL